MRRSAGFPALLILALLNTPALGQGRIIHPVEPDIDGKVVEVMAKSDGVLDQILIEGSTTETGRAYVAVTEDSRILELRGIEWVPIKFDDIHVGQRALVWFLESKPAHLTYPLEPNGLVIAIVPPNIVVRRPPTPHPGLKGDEPIRLGGNLLASKLLHRVQPDYPKEAKEKGLQGIVLLQVVVDKEGKVEEAKLIRGHPPLAQAALEAVMQWRYEPMTLKGEPIRVIGTVAVNFRLDEK